MKNIRKIAAMIMAVAMLVIAGACAAQPGETETPAAEAPATEAPASEAPASEAPAAASDFDTNELITVVSREEGSGTRSAFIELFGVEQEDASGNKVDMTTVEANISNSTSVVMTTVGGNEYAIGYISLGSLNDTVKAVQIEGVDATVENIKNGSYAVSRPFNIATKEGLSEVAADFVAYIMSAEGQAIVAENGYITVADDAAAYAGSAPAGNVVVAGSSSGTPVMEIPAEAASENSGRVMEKLAEGYQAVNPNATIEVQQSDSSTGMNMAMEGTCDIGMASRALKGSELEAGLTPTVIAMDGIAVIVNNASPVSNLSVEQVRSIFTGEVTEWSEILG